MWSSQINDGDDDNEKAALDVILVNDSELDSSARSPAKVKVSNGGRHSDSDNVPVELMEHNHRAAENCLVVGRDGGGSWGEVWKI